MTTQAPAVAEYDRRVRRLDPYFTGHRIASIDQSVADGYVVKRQGDGARAATIRRELSTLTKMLRLAYRNRKLMRLPLLFRAVSHRQPGGSAGGGPPAGSAARAKFEQSGARHGRIPPPKLPKFLTQAGSSAGRARPLQGRGRGFDPRPAYQSNAFARVGRRYASASPAPPRVSSTTR